MDYQQKMNKLKTTFFILVFTIQIIILALLTQEVTRLKEQSLLLPAKIDLLISLGEKEINLECPPCPECKDYSKDFKKLQKLIKDDDSTGGYYYWKCQ
jgi:hypothetical protein